MARTKTTVRLDRPRTSKASVSGMSPRGWQFGSQYRTEKEGSKLVKKGRSQGIKGKKRMWSPTVMATQLARENWRVKQEGKD